MEAFTIKLYNILNFVNNAIYEPVSGLGKDINIPLVTAFLLGILGSTAPCQITTNLGAVGFISKNGDSRIKLLYNTLWYTLGKMTTYLFYGVIILFFNTQLQKTSIPLFSLARRLVGPIVILVGLYVLGIIRLRGSVGDGILSRTSKYIRKFRFLPAPFVMGVIFSLAFCPTLLWLFVGSIVPLSIKSSSGLVLPVIFSLGTLVPIFIIVGLIILGNKTSRESIRGIKNKQSVFKTMGGIFLVMMGILDTMIYWLN